jgi:hypothetical protein
MRILTLLRTVHFDFHRCLCEVYFSKDQVAEGIPAEQLAGKMIGA